MEEHVVEKNEGFDNTRFNLMGKWELKDILFKHGGDDSDGTHEELVERVRVLWLERNGKPRGPPPANLFRRSPWQGEDPPVQRVFRSRGAYEGTSPSRSRSRSRDRSPCRRRHDDDDPLVAATTSLSLQDTARKAARRAESTKRLNKTVDSFLSEATVSKSMPVAPRGCPGPSKEVPDDLYAPPSRRLSQEEIRLGPYLRQAVKARDKTAVDLMDQLNKCLEEATPTSVTLTLTSEHETEIDKKLEVLAMLRKLELASNMQLKIQDYIELGVPPAWCSFVGTSGLSNELKTLDALKVPLEKVVVYDWGHYQRVAKQVHMDVLTRVFNNDLGGAAAAAWLSANVPLPAEMLDVAAAHGAEINEGSDPLVLKKVMVLVREAHLLAQAPDLSATAKCAVCGESFNGPARTAHAKKAGPCRDAILEMIQDQLHYCDGSCGDVDCNRSKYHEPLRPFLSAGACDRHKAGLERNYKDLRFRDFRKMEAFKGKCICDKSRCHLKYCPLMEFSVWARAKFKERPPCTCNKPGPCGGPCKRTCPKRQFMIRWGLCSRDNPYASYGVNSRGHLKSKGLAAAETDAGYESDGSAALVCVPVQKG